MLSRLKTLEQPFSWLARYNDRHFVFDVMCDFILCKFREEPPCHEAFVAIANRLSAPDAFEKLLYLMSLVEELTPGYNDPLGDLFMEHVSSRKGGQFFTPLEVSSLLAELTVTKTKVNDFPLVLDPAAGSGRTLLRAAALVPHQLFVAADIDLRCCKICLINFLYNFMIGEIAHMDSLSLKFYSGYITLVRKSGKMMYPYFKEFTGAENSIFFRNRKGPAS